MVRERFFFASAADESDASASKKAEFVPMPESLSTLAKRSGIKATACAPPTDPSAPRVVECGLRDHTASNQANASYCKGKEASASMEETKGHVGKSGEIMKSTLTGIVNTPNTLDAIQSLAGTKKTPTSQRHVKRLRDEVAALRNRVKALERR